MKSLLQEDFLFLESVSAKTAEEKEEELQIMIRTRWSMLVL